MASFRTASVPTQRPQNAVPAVVLPSGSMRFHFMAWLPQGIAGAKFTTFVAEQDARIVEVTENQLRLHIGRKRWLTWKGRGEAFPIEVQLTLHHQTLCTRSLTHLVADFRPRVTHVPLDVLRRRFQQVAQSLRSCLLAQDLEVI